MIGSLMLVLLAAAMNGSFATPMKWVRGWEWENTWLVWSFVGMIIIPGTVAAFTVPHLRAVYSLAGTAALERIALYGMVWGVSAVLFGLGISRVGLALGFGIILGVSSSLGAIVPMVKLHRDRLFTTAGLLGLIGVAVIVGGVLASAHAGLLREASSTQRSGHDSFALGLVICVLSGIGSMFMSLALNEAQPIFGAAEAMGASTSHAMNAVWPVLLSGGFAVNGGYCSYKLMRRHSVIRFGSATAMNLVLSSAMAILWSGSNFLYGAGARGMGSLGLVLAWPVFMAAIVLTANSWGVFTGEWRGAGTRATRWALVGVLFLIVGICVLTSAERAS